MSDYISRADAIEALSRSSVYAWSTEQDLVAHSWAIRILQSLPSADAVQGEWIEYTDCEGKTRTITCSECGWEEHSWIDTNYCPNCGAKMYKGGDDE